MIIQVTFKVHLCITVYVFVKLVHVYTIYNNVLFCIRKNGTYSDVLT